jgi:alpha-tubulin suppressor-like RCC1 family protein
MKRAWFVTLTLGLAACSGDRLLPTSPVEVPDLSPDIADAVHGYRAGFFWLPPMVSSPAVTGAFDPALSPTVEICELVADACGTVIAVYTTTSGPGGEVVRLEEADELYHVNWQTAKFPLSSTRLYRVYVRAGLGNTLLGYADVQLVDNGSGFKNLDTGEKIGLVSGRTLPIKFRIESALVGQVEVQPGQAEAAPGATRQFVAVLRDLHGNAMNAVPTWASSAQAVATVDQTGLAIAVAGGVTTISATVDRVSGAATLTVAGGTIVASTGGTHACALDAAGRASCWGFGTFGQLGNGSTVSSSMPVAVAGDLTFMAIEADANRTCGITTAFQAYCWGRGFLGDGTVAVAQSTPVPVSGGLSFQAISLGANHSCALTTTGQAYCWGFGSLGTLGNGSEAQQLVPVPVSGGLTFTAISVGDSHTCALTADDQLYCWGGGQMGRLGNGGFVNQLVPGPVSGGLTFTAVSAGANHTCAVATDGSGYCWGSGGFGQLGSVFTLVQFTPRLVLGGLSFAGIAAGSLHSCGLTTGGQAYCWGNNANGELGNGTRLTTTVPVAVSGGLTFASLDAGSNASCAVGTDDQVFCWGAGGLGQLGNGTTPSFQVSPVPVAPVQ